MAIKYRVFYPLSAVPSSSTNSLIIEMKLLSSLFVLASIVVGGFAAVGVDPGLSTGITNLTTAMTSCTGLIHSLDTNSTVSDTAVCLLCLHSILVVNAITDHQNVIQGLNTVVETASSLSAVIQVINHIPAVMYNAHMVIFRCRRTCLQLTPSGSSLY